MVWLTNWNYQKQLNINGSSAGSQTNYQMNIIINYGSGIDGTPVNNIYCNGLCNADFSDIRFTDSTGNLLYYWIESYTIGSNATVWVKVPNIPTGSSYIYFYYYNPSPPSDGYNNPNNTFIFFDNFSRGNYSGWTPIGGSWTATTSGGKTCIRATGNNVGINSPLFTAGTAWSIFYRFYSPSSNGGINDKYQNSGASVSISKYACTGDAGCNNQYRLGDTIIPATWTYSSGWHVTETRRWGNTAPYNYQIFLDGTSYGTGTNSTVWNLEQIQSNAGWNATDHSWTDFRVRNYISPEPSWGTIITAHIPDMIWLTGWNRRKQLYINGSNIVTQLSYQMRLTVYQGNGADSTGNIYCGGHIKADFSDLRITQSDGITLLNYWIESITGTSPNLVATIWVLIGSIPTGSDATYIYMYYDNSSASTVSNKFNTFVRIIGDDATQVLKAAWMLDEGTGITANDKSGNGYNGTINNGTWITDTFGNALSFNGTNTSITLSTTVPTINNSNFAWYARIKTNVSSSNANGGTVLAKRGGTSDQPVNVFGVSNGKAQVWFQIGTGSSNYAFTGTSLVNDGNTHYPIVQRNTTVNQLQIWVDGVDQTNISFSGDTVGSVAQFNSGAGYQQNCGTSYGCFNGTIGDLLVFTTLLTSSQIADLSTISQRPYLTLSYPGRVLIRKYVSPEPSWSSTIGAEQGPVTFNISSNPSGGEIWLNTPSGTSNWADQHVSTPSTIYVPSSVSYDVMVGVSGYQQWYLTNVCTGNCAPGYSWNIVANPVLLPGSLVIYSTPSGASIYIDGSITSSGTTVDGGITILDVSVGSHSIKLSLTGYVDWTGNATVNTQASTTVRAVFAGSATVSSTPTNSSIYLDGSLTSIGNTSLTITNLTPITSDGTRPTQSHNYILRLAGYVDTSGSFIATAGSTINISVTFPGSLYITSIPVGAQIYIDGVLQ